MTQPDPALIRRIVDIIDKKANLPFAATDAVLAALRDAGWRDPDGAPTQWAYDRACEALHKHRARADAAEAELAADREAHARLFEQRDEAITERDRLRERLIAEREAHAAHCRDEERTYGELTREFELAAAERDRLRAELAELKTAADSWHDGMVQAGIERDALQEAARDVVEVIRPNVGTLFGSARAAGERFIAAVDAYDAQPKATGGVIDPANLVDTSGGGCVFPPFAREETRTDG